MRLPGGIRVRLAIGVLVIVGGALLAAYLIVAPSLENRLVSAKLNGLERSAAPLGDGAWLLGRRGIDRLAADRDHRLGRDKLPGSSFSAS